MPCNKIFKAHSSQGLQLLCVRKSSTRMYFYRICGCVTKVGLYPFNKMNCSYIFRDTCLGKRNLIFTLTRVKCFVPNGLAFLGWSYIKYSFLVHTRERKEPYWMQTATEWRPITLLLLWSLGSSVGVICVFVHIVLTILLF